MRRKLLVILLIVAAAGGTVAIADADATPPKAGEPAAAAAPPPQQPAEEPGFIDGSKNPELIPDHVAYSLLFRLISGDQSAEAKKRIRSYVRLMGLGDQSARACDGEIKPADPAKERDVDAFIAAADEFQRRVSVLDREAAEIKKRNWPNPDAATVARLVRLQRQKERITAEIVASLPGRLSAEGALKVRAHVSDRMKRRMKMKSGQPDSHPLAPLPGSDIGH